VTANDGTAEEEIAAADPKGRLTIDLRVDRSALLVEPEAEPSQRP
jgi:hypothetical protein